MEYTIIVVDQDGKIVYGFPMAVLLETYNYAIGFVNPLYAEWNQEFERDYPGLDGYSKEYNEFMTKKVNEILEMVEDWPWRHWHAKAATLPGDDIFTIAVFNDTYPTKWYATLLKEV